MTDAPPCTDCRFHEYDRAVPGVPRYHWCSAGRRPSSDTDPVTGRPVIVGSITLCSNERAPLSWLERQIGAKNRCGPHGSKFQAIPPRPAPPAPPSIHTKRG